MSNAYTNQILFGYSKSQVNKEYIDGLLSYMLTHEKITSYIPESTDVPIPVPVTVPIVVEVKAEAVAEEDEAESKVVNTDKGMVVPRRGHSYNSIFWSIYGYENPKEVFFGTRANEEIEQRMKVVELLKKIPKRLKDTNSKLTIEQTNALFGAMMVSKDEKIDFCIAYAVYYNKPIMVVYNKTYCIYSPTVEIDLSEDVIILYASESLSTKNGKRSFIYHSENTPTRQIIDEIVHTKVIGPLKAMSNYKSQELDEIAFKLEIDIKQTDDKGKEKRRKKEDIYNDIRVAIHFDQHT
jgi:hypothetical protein